MRRTRSVLVVGVVVLVRGMWPNTGRPARRRSARERGPAVAGAVRDRSSAICSMGQAAPELKPRGTTFIFVTRDTTGWSPGFDVRDNDGTEWSVKLGPEAQTEVVASRILWAIGYHQPPTYYLDGWNLTGQESGPQAAGRFRPSLANRKVVGDWSWYENPFVGSRAFGGLIVANLILNSWDWKTSNNKVYDLSEPVNGVRRWFVVRDLGASLGKTSYPRVLKWFRLRGFGQGTRNDLPGFEEQGFIKRIDTELARSSTTAASTVTSSTR